MEGVVKRFLNYVSIDTQSIDGMETVPSTEKQFVLARNLANEMKEMGISNVRIDEHCYVYGEIPANTDDAMALGFIAHMDTSDAASGKGVNPRIVEKYQGGPIVLNDEVTIDPEVSRELHDYIGQDLIVTDGTTLLGSDDKAGIAEILTMAERLMTDDHIKHGKICIAFTPDEEIGRGTDYFDVEGFGADFAYTVDGGHIGELEYENFNGALAVVNVRGVDIHPGSAKDVMKNAIHIGMEFNMILPQEQRPEYTQDREGFFHLIHFEGEVGETKLVYLIREHDLDKYEAKKMVMTSAAKFINAKYGNVLKLEIQDGYKNMKEKIIPHMHLIDDAKAAFIACGIEPRIVPIRGGTDGATLSFMGLPCPNLSTGGENFHSVREYIPVQSMTKMVDVLVELVRISYDK
ncbi:MAG: peptidase T [Firmicutes bacterium]|nr:peptidase T [Bacillota bacterium]